MIGHSFFAGGVAPIPGEVKAAASRHSAKRGFGLEFPWDRGKMTKYDTEIIVAGIVFFLASRRWGFTLSGLIKQNLGLAPTNLDML